MNRRALNHIRLRNPAPIAPRVRTDDVQVDDMLVADGGHVCLRSGRVVRVHRGSDRALFVSCAHGRHYLSHSQTPAGYLIGLYRKEQMQ